MSTPLTAAEIDSALASLPGWSNEGDSIAKKYEFADFPAEMPFMVRAAVCIDAMDPPPA